MSRRNSGSGSPLRIKGRSFPQTAPICGATRPKSVSTSLAFISRTKWWAQDVGLPQKQIRCSDSSSMVPGKGADKVGVGETGKRECACVLGSFCCVPGQRGLGLSYQVLGLRAIRMAGVYMACIFANAKASALASLILGSSVELAALPARNGERISGLTLGNENPHLQLLYHLSHSYPPRVPGYLPICNK